MDPASLPVVTRDRLAYFRELRARLDPSGDPADAMAERHVEVPGSASSRIAAELSLAPSSSHLLIGGGGSGKTTQLLAAQRLVSHIPDVRALYIDVSKQHDIATLTPGVVVVQVGLTLASVLEDVPHTKPFAKRLHEIADGSTGQIASNLQQVLQPLEGLLRTVQEKSEHLVVMLDGLDRMTDVHAFEQLAIFDVKALAAAGVGVVLAGPFRVLYGLDRIVTDHFDSFHYQPWIDVRQLSSGRLFFTEVLRKRVSAHAFTPPGIDALVLASGGVLRDLLTLAQSACIEAYLHGADCVGLAEAAAAIDAFGRKHIQGLRPAEIEILQRIRTQRSFVQTSESDLALLMTRRVLEYHHRGRLQYAVHPTVEDLLQVLAEL